jgi:aspartyl-tRNA(Asn)/glutamyl-tRNA(Gln) amidotransferase subunit B
LNQCASVVKNTYKADIGLEVHVELATRSKMFCSCAVVDTTTASPNSSVCEVCCGMPGTLPVINRSAVELAMKAALALNCTVVETSNFARKNYFYPDLPKGYQISQYEYPLAVNGFILINTSEGEKCIRVRRAHLEEDTGKLTHVSRDGKSYSLVDLNRAGVPLLEIVSEPDMHSVDDVRAYSRNLRALLRWLGVSSGDMEKGTMRFEANLSLRQDGCDELGTRVEIKNLNSFKAMELAILYQMDIQREKLDKGEKVKQQTLGWNENQGKTVAQRSKEDANDYRYFPEPDLPPLVVESSWLEEVKVSMPELPDTRRARYRDFYDLNCEDIERLVEDKSVSDFFEACLAAAPKLSPKRIANWLLTDLFAWLNQNSKVFVDIGLSAELFVCLVSAVDDGIVNQNTGKEVLIEMLVTGQTADAIIEKKGLRQVSDGNLITTLIAKTLKENPGEVRSYLDGKETVANWLFGQVMRSAQGKANPQIIKEELNRQLKKLK